ncbi:PAS domain-containing protein [Streptomyces sp. B3I7]|jgi:PAS domain-containing protein|uniref:PAS domain-containing protein n=1 Tax=unclassified Streptomyces TaxID=2593676 RepID=UPI002788BF4D|nr:MULTISPECIES: PAS domain-containing protein [unclassified Streptomyces]MDQ0784869.1 PAS domain-containing protein [Streptomyces sp. B3I8]MDQ0808648.1 PAS domain-containing protein [Streptomyces sp. B3I7]
MPNDQQNTPSIEQLIDVIANSSVGIAVTDRTGAVVLHNRAQSVLMSGEADHLGGRILLDSAQNGLQTLIERLVKEQRVENVQVTYRGVDGGNEHAARVNAVLTGSGDDTRIHWVSRPELSERLPVPNDATEDATSDATSWIRAVNEQPLPALAPTKELEDVMREFYEVAPVAIHLIGVNGQVMHANPADIALVEYTSSPSDYVGGHIRTIYADEGLLDDFLGRWDEDSPIINFRADFLTKQGTPKPVLIFSTAQAEGGSVTNTRCFVFSDPEPQRARDTISAFGWPA